MFTGIVDHCGIILSLTEGTQSLKAVIQCAFTDLAEGESIAVDGICLTAINPQSRQFSCDISPETLRLTTASEFVVGRKVNLERSLRMGDRVGGHWVMGHVDQTAWLKEKQQQENFTTMLFAGIAPENIAFIVKKGSIAINGTSLTVNEVYADSFQVMLIPHTLERTNLQSLLVHDKVNLEFDWMTRVVVNQFREMASANLK